MKITTEKTDQGVDVVSLEGDLDYQVSGDLRGGLNKLVDEGATKIVVRLEKVNYLDSSGIASFVELAQKIKRRSGKVVFCGLTETVKKVFELAKLQLFFTLTDSYDNALKSF